MKPMLYFCCYNLCHRFMTEDLIVSLFICLSFFTYLSPYTCREEFEKFKPGNAKSLSFAIHYKWNRHVDHYLGIRGQHYYRSKNVTVP